MHSLIADHAADQAHMASITDRQREVLDLVVQYRTSKEIARALNISPNTVDQRINGVRTKLGAKDRAETARMYAALDRRCRETGGRPGSLWRGAIDLANERGGHLVNRVVPAAGLNDSKLWRFVAIVLIAAGTLVLATAILAVMQALNALI